MDIMVEQQGDCRQYVSSVFMLFRTETSKREGMVEEHFCISAYKSVDPVL